MVDKKPWYTSKTLWFNFLTIGLTVLEMVADLPFITPEYSQVILIVVAAINVGLRLVTSQPVTEAGVRTARRVRSQRSAGMLLICLLAIPAVSCGHSPWDPGSADGTTVYRSADRARTVLTALQTLRYHSAQEVAKATVQGRITQERADQFRTIDDRFRQAWGIASELVAVWLASGGAPPKQLQPTMAEVEALASEIEAQSREVQ